MAQTFVVGGLDPRWVENKSGHTTQTKPHTHLHQVVGRFRMTAQLITHFNCTQLRVQRGQQSRAIMAALSQVTLHSNTTMPNSRSTVSTRSRDTSSRHSSASSTSSLARMTGESRRTPDGSKRR